MLSSADAEGVPLDQDKTENAEAESSDNHPLNVEISDAISEKESVKFTILIKTSLPAYAEAKGSEFKIRVFKFQSKRITLKILLIRLN